MIWIDFFFNWNSPMKSYLKQLFEILFDKIHLQILKSKLMNIEFNVAYILSNYSSHMFLLLSSLANYILIILFVYCMKLSLKVTSWSSFVKKNDQYIYTFPISYCTDNFKVPHNRISLCFCSCWHKLIIFWLLYFVYKTF